MSVEVKIPAVGESISSGIVSVWHKKSGDFVKAGDPLFTLETDKVSTEITAETSGVLDTIVPEGQEVKIGEVVATIDDSKKAPASTASKESVGGAGDASPARTVSGKPTASPTKEKEKSADGETLSPAVRRIVDEENLDPKKIQGTGPEGRITKADALAAVKNRGGPQEKAPKEDRAATAAPSAGEQSA